jgi:hypothetical protein
MDIANYELGIKDAIAECEAELLCIDIHYADMSALRNAAMCSVKNCILLLQDKLTMLKEN